MKCRFVILLLVAVAIVFTACSGELPVAVPAAAPAGQVILVPEVDALFKSLSDVEVQTFALNLAKKDPGEKERQCQALLDGFTRAWGNPAPMDNLGDAGWALIETLAEQCGFNIQIDGKARTVTVSKPNNAAAQPQPSATAVAATKDCRQAYDNIAGNSHFGALIKLVLKTLFGADHPDLIKLKSRECGDLGYWVGETLRSWIIGGPSTNVVFFP